jgi:hypothetical protein
VLRSESLPHGYWIEIDGPDSRRRRIKIKREQITRRITGAAA